MLLICDYSVIISDRRGPFYSFPMWISYGTALSNFAYLFFENKLLPKSLNNFYFHPANSHERENRPDDLQCICMPPINTAISVHEVCIDFDQILRTFSKQTHAPRPPPSPNRLYTCDVNLKGRCVTVFFTLFLGILNKCFPCDQARLYTLYA